MIFTLATPVCIYQLLEWMPRTDEGAWVGWLIVASLLAARSISYLCFMQVCGCVCVRARFLSPLAWVHTCNCGHTHSVLMGWGLS